MKTGICVYIIAAAGIMFSGCNKSKRAEDQRYTWSSDAPLTIPYRTRLQRLEKANLVRNHSFETGRTFTIDSSTTSFVVDGWQQIGRHIQWVDNRNDSLYKPDEVLSGNRAIKIIRGKANETDDQGEGILSDFIKVIPGNYNLSLYLRLESIFPLKARLGTKMADGVDINLQFYDRNKIPLKPELYFPHVSQNINTSFKSLSFANFSSIPAFGWGKVIGKSHHFPFPEGDIPSEAQYVKIFIGLKGTGKLWVDSVSFSYGDRNFSVAERMQKFVDTTFFTREALIPTPKIIVQMASVFLFKPGMNEVELPVIVVPADIDAVGMNAARMIQKALQESAGRYDFDNMKSPDIQIINECSKQQLENAKLIIALGKSTAYKKYQEKLPLDMIKHRSGGYFIYSPGDFTNLVILGANNSIGLYYASLTLTQLIDDKAPVFHNARIVDYPDFPQRYYAIESKGDKFNIEQQAELAKELTTYKLNGAFLSGFTENNRQAVAEEFGSYSPVLDGNLFCLTLLPAYRLPDDTSLTYQYPILFERKNLSPTSVENNAIPFTASENEQTPVLYLPPVFHNQMLDNSDYLTVFSASGNNRKCLYAGSSFFSLLTDDADIERYSSIMGACPVFMDNSMRISTLWGQYGGCDPYYPGRIRLFNIFEPFGNQEIRKHFSKLDSTLFFINLPAASEIDIIRLATAADFLWNARAYTSDFSLWKVLLSRYGAENARDLITYADKYGLMLEVILRLEMNNQAARNFKTGQQVIAELTALVAKTNMSLGSQNILVKELQSLNAQLRNKLNYYSSSLPVKK